MVKNSPAANAARKEESRHDQFWYPQRCEHPGCSETSKEKLKKCSACKMLLYCSKEHQSADWPAHKDECKVFQRVRVHATFYTDEEMLRRYPLQPCGRSGRYEDSEDVPVPPGSSCPLCGKNDQQEHMTRSQCCNQVICDNTDSYVMHSFSRDFCERSHDRYTLCGYHGVEDDCDVSKDWRECPKCSKVGINSGVADKLWRGLNSYNFCPLLSEDVPRHSRCETCPKCKKKFISGMEGSCSMAEYDDLCCLRCVDYGRYM